MISWTSLCVEIKRKSKECLKEAGFWHEHSHMSAFGQQWLRFSRVYTEHYSIFLVHSTA
jgi:hypothetical protein